MNQKELEMLIEEMRALPKENEWTEFKDSNYNPQTIGEYLSALSNSACLENKDFAYLVFGIENETHQLTGTSFLPTKEKVGLPLKTRTKNPKNLYYFFSTKKNKIFYFLIGT